MLRRKLKRIGKRIKGWGTLYWDCMKIMMRARTIIRMRGPTMISLHMISLRCAMDVSDFYYMATEFYKANPVPGFRVCERECDSLGSVKDDISDDEEESN